jgi:hypothetical protein
VLNSRLSLMCWADQCGYHHEHPLDHFWNVHHFLTCCTITVPSLYSCISWWWRYLWEKDFVHKNRITLQTYFVDLVSSVVVMAYKLNSNWLTNSCTICCRFPYSDCCHLWKYKILDQCRIYRLRELISTRCLLFIREKCFRQNFIERNTVCTFFFNSVGCPEWTNAPHLFAA